MNSVKNRKGRRRKPSARESCDLDRQNDNGPTASSPMIAVQPLPLGPSLLGFSRYGSLVSPLSVFPKSSNVTHSIQEPNGLSNLTIDHTVDVGLDSAQWLLDNFPKIQMLHMLSEPISSYLQQGSPESRSEQVVPTGSRVLNASDSRRGHSDGALRPWQGAQHYCLKKTCCSHLKVAARTHSKRLYCAPPVTRTEPRTRSKIEKTNDPEHASSENGIYHNSPNEKDTDVVGQALTDPVRKHRSKLSPPRSL